ncbi:hypothetical protein [Microbacterium sp.]|uniref:hypothetical protein n=1 Tax=Microbacterium sp. TaxID=51671 RepID=UPI003A91AFC8
MTPVIDLARRLRAEVASRLDPQELEYIDDFIFTGEEGLAVEFALGYAAHKGFAVDASLINVADRLGWYSDGKRKTRAAA